MKNRERQRENKRLEKKVVCPHHRCAGNKEGNCRALRSSNSGDKMCPFFKTTEQNEKEKKAAIARLIIEIPTDCIDHIILGPEFDEQSFEEIDRHPEYKFRFRDYELRKSLGTGVIRNQ